MTIDEVKQRLEIFKTPLFNFNEERHEYHYDGIKMKSVTGWIGTFVKPFDAEKWTEKKAIDYGVSKEEVAHGWKRLSDDANELGHDVHKFIERFLNQENPELPEDEVQRKRVLAWLDYYNLKFSKMTLVAQEIRIWSKKYGLAGTIDALWWWKNQLIVGDWKTNKKMKTDADKSWNNMLYPFENEAENTINKYSLQTSTYQAILRENGIPTEKAFICWISPSAEVKVFQAKNYVDKIENYLMAYPVNNSFLR